MNVKFLGHKILKKMKIYTKTGDDGTTSLISGKRLLKSHPRIETYGSVDELNAHIGLLRDLEINQSRKNILTEVQDRLFTIGSLLASDPQGVNFSLPELFEKDVLFLEEQIDEMNCDLPPMTNFVLPGGHIAVSYCHIARTVCRRAERMTIALAEDKTENVSFLIIRYLNRLSDYLFVLSRLMTYELGAEEVIWKPRMS
jgi:cob(I)alamin adenosyltransferase